MKRGWFIGLLWALAASATATGALSPGATNVLEAVGPPTAAVYVIPIREDIMPPLIYLVRRGVKEAMDAKANVLVLDMDTNGGRVDSTEEIMKILGNFKGQTVTFVHNRAFSAGAFISFATQKIYMAPQSVIGAAAPVMMSPTGSGATDMPETMEVKAVSAISALVRAQAEKNGHNVEVAEAMVKKTKELKIDGKVLNEKGQILTLTSKEAEAEYGTPPRRLLSEGTVESVEELVSKLGHRGAKRVDIKPTGAESIATWLTAISPILMMIGIVGIYIEIKTPGFGLPGILGIGAFALYFLGGYIAGLSGLEWVLVFVLGVALVAVELFAFPGTILPGLFGFGLMFIAIVMAMVDMYPGTPALPTLPALHMPLRNFGYAMAGSIISILLLARLLPHTALQGALVSLSASGTKSVQATETEQKTQLKKQGVALSVLRPSGKAQFDDQILDVMTQGEMIAKGQRVRIIGHSGASALVECVS